MIAHDISDPELKAHLERLAPDGLSLFTLESPDGPVGGELRGALLHGTRMINLMRESHGLGILETYALGEAYLAAGLLGSTLKGEDKLSLRMDCEGPVGGFSVEARAIPPAAPGAPGGSAVRGYLLQDSIEVEVPPETFDLSSLVGAGTLTLTRFIAGTPRPFTGSVSLKSGRFAQDLAAFFQESEQVSTAFDLGLHFGRTGRVIGAGGLYLQALPGATESMRERAESALESLPPLGKAFSEGARPEEVLARTFASLGFTFRGRAEAVFHCPCAKERFASFLAGAEGGLLDDLIQNGPWPAELTCHNCGSHYFFPKEELEGLAGKAQRGAKS